MTLFLGIAALAVLALFITGIVSMAPAMGGR